MRRPSILLAALAASVQLLIAGPAEARTLSVQLELPSQSGYDLSFGASTFRGKSSASLSIERSSRIRGSSVSYFGTGGKVSARRVDVRLPPVGEVSATFDERSSRQIEVPGCKRGITVRSGVFEGRFFFEDADGFVDVFGPLRAKGKVTVGSIGGCTGSGAKDRPGGPALFASCNEENDALYTVLGGNGFPASHSATLFEEIARLDLIRSTWASGEEDDFRFAGDLSTATVTPPLPFSGSGDYESGRLTGDLAARFLGLPEPQPLTPAKAKLKRGSLRLACGPGFGIAASSLRQPAIRTSPGPTIASGPRRRKRVAISAASRSMALASVPPGYAASSSWKAASEEWVEAHDLYGRNR